MKRLTSDELRAISDRVVRPCERDAVTDALVDTVAPGELRDDILSLLSHAASLTADLDATTTKHLEALRLLDEATAERDMLAALLRQSGHL
jgi:hypothetical protein